MKDLAHLNTYFLKYKKHLIWGIIFTIISNLFGIIPARMVRGAVDTIESALQTNQTSNSIQEVSYIIAKFGVLILIVAVLKGVFLFAVRQTIIVMSRHIEYEIKNEIYTHYQTLPQSFFKTNQTGDLMARISEDVSKVRMYIGPSIMYLLNMVVLVVLILTYMFSVNARLSLYVLIPMPLLSLSIYLVSTNINRRSEKLQKSLSKISVFSQESFSGIRIIKSLNRENTFIKNFRKQSLKYKREALGLNSVDALFSPLVGFLIGLCTVICVYIGGQEVIAGNLSKGNIVEFIMYVYMLTWPLTALGWTSGQIQRAAVSQKRINEFLNIKTEIISQNSEKITLKGKITFDKVSLTYSETGVEALRNISFNIEQGMNIAFVGSTGSGKSSIASLLMNLYIPTEGKILIDDKKLTDLDVKTYRDQVAFVPQDVFLFSDTIAKNIGFGNENQSIEKIIACAKAAQIHDSIMEFEKGYDTVIGERGITLSGGQKQRISIARALMKDSPIVILDDCLSAVDTETEALILENLKKHNRGKTSIIISHRVSNAKYADYVLVLDDGKLVENGTHSELLEYGGLYTELYHIQKLESEGIA
ncbi:MAG: ABC transporter ATP-binding protein [Leadbetterella sp.]